MKELHASCNLSKRKCDILLDNLMIFCERYKFTNDKFTTDKFTTDKFTTDKFTTDKFTTDKFTSDKFTSDKLTNYNSESKTANCASVNTLGGVTLNLTIKSPT